MKNTTVGTHCFSCGPDGIHAYCSHCPYWHFQLTDAVPVMCQNLKKLQNETDPIMKIVCFHQGK